MLDSYDLILSLKAEKLLYDSSPKFRDKQLMLHMVLDTDENHSKLLNVWKEVIETEFKDFFTLDDFMSIPKKGSNAGISGWLRALVALENGRPQAWDFIVTHFGKELTLEHFLMAPIEGPNAGTSGLMLVLSALANNHPQAWNFVEEHFGKQLTLQHFLTTIKEGPNAGMSGFWLALKAAAHLHLQAWDFIEEHFGKQLTLEHFLMAPIEGPHAGISGLWLLFSPEYDLESWYVSWVYLNFYNQLRVQHIEQTAALNNQSQVYSVLHLICQKKRLIEKLAQILINNADAKLKIDSIISDERVSSEIKLLLEMHQKIVKLQADIDTAVKENVITSQINALVDDAHQLQVKHQQSAGYFLLAQCLFTYDSQAKERLSCLRQTDEKSMFAEEASLEQANLLFITDCDKDGNELPSDLELKKHARKTALEEALKLVTPCPKAAHLKDSYIHLKRRIVAKLLDEVISLDNREAFSWADEITKYSALLLRIERERRKRQARVIDEMQTQLDTLSGEINAIKGMFIKKIETRPDQSLKGQLKITDMSAPISKRQKP